MILGLKTEFAQTVGYLPRDPELIFQDPVDGFVVVPSGCLNCDLESD